MKGRIKRSISLVLSTVIAFSMFVAGTCVASAANDDWKLGCYGLEGDFWTGYSGSLYLYSDDVEYNEDIISAKSSNTKVAKITKEIDVDTYLYFLECKKAGKTTITVSATDDSGIKKYSYTTSNSTKESTSNTRNYILSIFINMLYKFTRIFKYK